MGGSGGYPVLPGSKTRNRLRVLIFSRTGYPQKPRFPQYRSLSAVPAVPKPERGSRSTEALARFPQYRSLSAVPQYRSLTSPVPVPNLTTEGVNLPRPAVTGDPSLFRIENICCRSAALRRDLTDKHCLSASAVEPPAPGSGPVPWIM